MTLKAWVYRMAKTHRMPHLHSKRALQCVACLREMPCTLRHSMGLRHPLASAEKCHYWKRVRCSVLQCVAVCCSVLQCVAVCCFSAGKCHRLILFCDVSFERDTQIHISLSEEHLLHTRAQARDTGWLQLSLLQKSPVKETIFCKEVL